MAAEARLALSIPVSKDLGAIAALLGLLSKSVGVVGSVIGLAITCGVERTQVASSLGGCCDLLEVISILIWEVKVLGSACASGQEDR